MVKKITTRKHLNKVKELWLKGEKTPASILFSSHTTSCLECEDGEFDCDECPLGAELCIEINNYHDPLKGEDV